jgi:hypothetical protein
LETGDFANPATVISRFPNKGFIKIELFNRTYQLKNSRQFGIIVTHTNSADGQLTIRITKVTKPMSFPFGGLPAPDVFPRKKSLARASVCCMNRCTGAPVQRHGGYPLA